MNRRKFVGTSLAGASSFAWPDKALGAVANLLAGGEPQAIPAAKTPFPEGLAMIWS